MEGEEKGELLQWRGNGKKYNPIAEGEKNTRGKEMPVVRRRKGRAYLGGGENEGKGRGVKIWCLQGGKGNGNWCKYEVNGER